MLNMEQVAVIALYLIPLLALVVAVEFARRHYHRQDRRNPLTRNLQRPPGHTLSQKVEETQDSMYAQLGVIGPFPLFMWATSRAMPVSGWVAWVLVAVTVGVVALGAFRLALLVKRARTYRLGWEAEMATGQELSLLMRNGFHVFHDVELKGKFNIDHVVVGPNGLFAVETKGRAKPVDDGGVDAKVVYDGTQLQFPTWTEVPPVQQAILNAESLGNWLSVALAAPIRATPVLALPGWYVERTGRGPVMVINPTNCGRIFASARGEPLSERLVKQIVARLDERCRDVEPRTNPPPKER